MTKKRDHQEATEDDEVAAGAVPETDEVLAERCAEYVELNRQIKELGRASLFYARTKKGWRKTCSPLCKPLS
jgi:hypothetical protein